MKGLGRVKKPTRVHNMFCPQCGCELPENVQFCPQCGFKAETAPQDNAPQPQTTPVENTPVAENTPAVENTPAAENTPAMDNTPAPKKGKKGLFAAIGGAVAILVVLCLVFLDPLKAFFVTAFGSDVDYFRYVENKAFNSQAENVTDSLSSMADVGGVEAQAKIILSEEVKTLLSSAAGGMDLSWLQDITLTTDLNIDSKNSSLMSLGLDAKLGDKSIAELMAILDPQKGIYLSLVGITEKYAFAELDNYTNEEAMSMMSNLKIEDLLPDNSQLKELLNKYYEIVLNNITKVSKEKGTFTVGNISQDLTALNVIVDTQTAQAVVKALLTELKNDAEIKEIIDEAAKELINQIPQLANENPDEAYTAFQKAIDTALAEADGMFFGDQELFRLTTYVNGSHDIVGRSVTVAEREFAKYLIVKDGSDFAATLDVEGKSIITGSGTHKGGNVNGNFALVISGQELLTLQMEDFDMDAFKDGECKGTIHIKPSDSLYNYMGLDSSESAGVQVMDLGISLSMDTTGNGMEAKLMVTSRGSDLAGLEISTKTTDSETVDLPADEDCVDIEQWASTIDFGKLKENLQNAGVPQQITSILDFVA